MEQQMEEQALSAALAASLRDHHQQQQQHSQRQQQQRTDVRPRTRIDVEAVSGAVQVRARARSGCDARDASCDLSSCCRTW